MPQKSKISGGDVGGSKTLNTLLNKKLMQLKDLELMKMWHTSLCKCKYGSNVDQLIYITQTAPYHDSKLPLEIYVELVYSIQQEMVYKPTDS